MTMIATPETRPAITCPPWCTVTYEEHLSELSDLDGFVVHWSDLGRRVYIGQGTYADGTPDPTDPPQVHLDGMMGSFKSLDDVENLAAELAAAAKLARR